MHERVLRVHGFHVCVMCVWDCSIYQYDPGSSGSGTDPLIINCKNETLVGPDDPPEHCSTPARTGGCCA
jgi:hypothetical protein